MTDSESHWEYHIKQHLSQIEKAIGENSVEVARPNKVLKVSYNKIMANVTRVKSASASGDGDDLSGRSEASLIASKICVTMTEVIKERATNLL